MLLILQKLRHKVAIGFVGGSDLVKQQEQLGVNGLNGNHSIYLKEERRKREIVRLMEVK